MQLKLRSDFWFLAGLFILGFALRVVNLDLRSISLDESYSLALAHSGLRALIQGAAHDIHPPLFYILVLGWGNLFGMELLKIRILTSLFSALLIPASFYLSNLWLDRKGAWWVTGLVTLSPYLGELGRWARMPSLNALLCGLALYFFWQAFRKEKNTAFFVAYGVTTLAGLYTHYFSGLLLLCQYVFLAPLYLFNDREWFKGSSFKKWLVTQAGILLGFAPWVYIFMEHFVRKMGLLGRRPGFKLSHPVLLFYHFIVGSYNWGFVNKVLAIALFAAPVFILVKYYLPRLQLLYTLFEKRVWLWLLVLVFIPLLPAVGYSLIGSNILDVRYLSFSGLALLVIFGAALSRLPNRPAWWAGILLAAAFLVPWHNQWFDYGPVENWRQVAGLVKSQKEQNDILIIHPGHYKIPLQYYLDGVMPMIPLPGEFDIVNFKTTDPVPLTLPGLSRLDHLAHSHQRAWLILGKHNKEQSAVVKRWLIALYGPPREFAFFDIGVYLFAQPGSQKPTH